MQSEAVRQEFSSSPGVRPARVCRAALGVVASMLPPTHTLEAGLRTGALQSSGDTITRLAPQTGTGFLLPAGALLTVIDPEGGQVSDFFCFGALDHGEWLSSGRTIDIVGRVAIRQGDRLYSNRSRPMVTLVEDTCGSHDLLLTPCSQKTFDMLYPELGGAEHPSCLANLTRGLAQFGIGADQIASTFNIFMNVHVDGGGGLHIDPPRSRSGDRVVLRAEMDLHVGLTACSAEKSNGGTLKPIDFWIDRPPRRPAVPDGDTSTQ